MPRYVRIVFMEGDEGRDAVDTLCNSFEGYTAGTTAESIRSTVEYLSQWDDGSDDDIHDEPSHGACDNVVNQGDYVLSWNLGLGYVGLERVVS